jgi:polyisoprenoid-binding protein YceI
MQQWAIDPSHSQITFSVKHLGISTVRGSFKSIAGTIDASDDTIQNVHVKIDVDSISTGDQKRDDHLRSADFFDVASFPEASFVLRNATRTGDAINAQGELTLRGVTKPVTLTGEIGGPAKDPWGNTKVSATLSTKISRKEWGLTWNAALEAGGVLVSDEVKLDLEVQAAPAAV